MVYGFGSYGGAPYSALPDDEFRIEFNLDAVRNERPIIEVVSLVDQALIEQIYRSPEQLKVLDHRRFEELVAELFHGFGYEVELTQRTRDGGKDIIAIRQQEVDVKFLIECKRPDPGNPVAVSTVRELYGVKVSEGATKAILATTTYFTRDAQILSEKHRWELELRDFDAVKAWLAAYLRIKGELHDA
jgi:HJR/Mrr/RecB family endonuclease